MPDAKFINMICIQDIMSDIEEEFEEALKSDNPDVWRNTLIRWAKMAREELENPSDEDLL